MVDTEHSWSSPYTQLWITILAWAGHSAAVAGLVIVHVGIALAYFDTPMPAPAVFAEEASAAGLKILCFPMNSLLVRLTGQSVGQPATYYDFFAYLLNSLVWGFVLSLGAHCVLAARRRSISGRS